MYNLDLNATIRKRANHTGYIQGNEKYTTVTELEEK